MGSSDQPKILATRAALLDLNLKRVATVTMVTDDHAPEVVMYEGEPFLLSGDATMKPELTYLQVRAYRADALVIEEWLG
ncbi:MAG: hypothetical protein ABFD89_18625 [Bryobacteraceae bacterium]